MMTLLTKSPAALASAPRSLARAAPVLMQRISRRGLNVAAFKEDQPSESKEVMPKEKQSQQLQARAGQEGVLAPRLSPAHPIRRMSDMVREMDMLMNNFFGPSTSLFPSSAFDLLDTMPSPSTMLAEVATPMRSLAVHVDQDDKAYYVHAEVPGFSKDEVKINLHPDNTLSISAETKQEESDKDKEGKVTHWARRQSSFHRTMMLPDNVDPEAITATTKDGLLTVTIPKKELPEAKPKMIPVQ